MVRELRGQDGAFPDGFILRSHLAVWSLHVEVAARLRSDPKNRACQNRVAHADPQKTDSESGRSVLHAVLKPQRFGTRGGPLPTMRLPGSMADSTNTPIVLVTHNRPLFGVAETPPQEFSENYIEIFHEPNSPEHGQRVGAIARANWGKPYAAFNQNCEHFASFCYYEGKKSESPQVQAFIAAAGVVGLTAWAMSSDRS
jgi:hypothetical protein